MSTAEWLRPLTRPRVDPRMKERWLAARRAEGRRRLRILVAVASVAGIAGVSVGALESPLTAVHHLAVRGIRHETVAQVEMVTGIRPGRQMLSVDPAGAARRLERLPWVAGAVVRRHWLSTVAISVTERVAVAQVPASPATGTVLVDATGRILTGAGAPAPGLPVLAGAGPAGPPGTVLARAPADAQSLALAALFPPALAARVRRVSESGGVLTVQLYGSPAAGAGIAGRSLDSEGRPVGSGPLVPVLLGTGSQLAAKVTALATLVARLDLTRVQSVDLRVPTRPALTGSPQPITVSSTAGG
jgi:cell division protein FtsQ